MVLFQRLYLKRSLTLQVCLSRCARHLKPILASALGAHCSLRRLKRPDLTFKKLLLEKLSLGKTPFGKTPNFFILKHNHCFIRLVPGKVLMQGKLFQRCTHFLYCSVLSLGGKVNTRRMSHPDMESIFTKIIYEIFWSYFCEFSKLSKLNAFNLIGY